MKNGSWKWACALACAGALPQLAEAQSSSVTLYGIMDVGLQRTSAGGVGSVTGVSNGGYATSRLGFRGREDLGSGWSAGFVLEGSLNLIPARAAPAIPTTKPAALSRPPA